MGVVRYAERNLKAPGYRQAAEVDRRIIIRWRTPPAIIPLLLGSGFIALFVYRALTAKTVAGLHLMSLALALVIAYGMALLLFNRTELFVRDGELRFRRGPLPFPGEPPLPMDQIDRVVVRKRVKTSARGSKDIGTQFGSNHSVYAITHRGGERILARGVTPEDAVLVAEKMALLRARERR